ncbi:MAG TPA: peptide ABC transporter substrate-binding protein [Desulfobacteraceae bacterium]|nr:peptide ABC transporter substrate-binding protein [Desulfobacteraceae bacterium]
MTVKRILIIAPAALILFLVQSYFWVPTYQEQTRGNPDRLKEFINASIGDASLLNPILSADSSSSQVSNQIFEGLIDYDEELRFRGRIAESWKLTEEAYFYVNLQCPIPGEGIATASRVRDVILEARSDEKITGRLQATLALIKGVEVLPAKDYTVEPPEAPGLDDRESTPLTLYVKAPPRIKLSLDAVDQHLFVNLEELLGKEYFSSFDAAANLAVSESLPEERLRAVAEKILPPTEHNPVIVFKLRPGVLFHDGHEVDSADVKFTYEAIMNPANLSPRTADYEPVKSVEIIDPRTVRIVYKRLYSPAIGTWAIGILPSHLLDDQALKREALRRGMDPDNFSMRLSEFNRRPIGSGPFKFREWKADRHIVLDRFEDYWEGAPLYQRYYYRIIPDLLTQEMEFYAGSIDSYDVQPHQVERLSADPGFQSFSGTAFGYTYIGYNMRRKPFDDVRVRLALGMAIDKLKIIDYVLYGQGELITGPFAKQTDFYDHSIEPVPYDPEGALALLEKAGWRRGRDGWLEKDGNRLQFTLITNSGNDLRKAVLAIAQDSWRRIGVDVRTDLLEWSVFLQERINKTDFDACVLGWSLGIDPDLYQIWHSSQTNPHQLNFVGFKNAEADDLIIKIRQEYDHQKQVEYCHKLHRIIAREQPYTFLYVGKWTAVLDKRIVIVEKDEGGDPVYKKITPTKTGNYAFHFNKWIKLPEAPEFSAD